MTQGIKTYKGYEIHPLVYPRRTSSGVTHRNSLDSGYDASVRICRVGAKSIDDGRVFRLAHFRPFEGAGKARMACMEHATNVIDGHVDGQSVADL
ncbi:hypothetical protein H3V53_09770 [Paraburkholderia bengalensis]|uniref:Uncharacterized protein n=1 Tax=Paraburkholderia bengalensis TaxID=2747562 RepID=A0ABU8IQA4_9BURK